MKKQILFINEGIIEKKPGVSGGEMRYFKIAEYLKGKGYQIHFLGSQGLWYLTRKMGIKTKFHLIPEVPQVKIAVLLRAFHSPFIPRSLHTFQGIVYSTSEQMTDVLPALVLKILRGKKVNWITVVHWMPPLKFWHRQKATILNSFLFLINQRIGLYLAYLFANKLLCVSASTKQQLEKAKLTSKKIYIVNCGVDFNKIRSIVKKVKQKKYSAVFMKRLQSVKGVLDLPSIWAEVVKNKPKAKLAVIGSGLTVDNQKAKKMIKELKINNQVDFLGTIYDYKKKYSILAESRLFILPSYEENWAIVVGEAMAAGIPVICYQLKELNMVWKDSVTYIPLGDSKAMAKKIISLLKDNKALYNLSQKGINFVKRYDWASITKRELKIINRKT